MQWHAIGECLTPCWTLFVCVGCNIGRHWTLLCGVLVAILGTCRTLVGGVLDAMLVLVLMRVYLDFFGQVNNFCETGKHPDWSEALSVAGSLLVMRFFVLAASAVALIWAALNNHVGSPTGRKHRRLSFFLLAFCLPLHSFRFSFE